MKNCIRVLVTGAFMTGTAASPPHGRDKSTIPCVAHHKTGEHGKSCLRTTTKLVKNGGKWYLCRRAVYSIDNQVRRASEHAGHTVKLTGV
jgi:hypothetical protein